MTERSEDKRPLMQLAGFAMAHAVWCVSDDEVLIPMMMVESGGHREVLRFQTERLEEGVEEGRRHLVANPDQADRAVLVYDAYLTTEDGRRDALIGEARDFAVRARDESGEADATEGGPESAGTSIVVIYQPYRPAGSEAGFGVYSPKLEFPAESQVDRQAAAEAFLQGLSAHEKGSEIWDRCFLEE